MLALEFFTWWYGQGWRDVMRQTGQRLHAVGEAFSVGTLLRTLFAPWRRIVTNPGAGLNAHFHAAIDNAVSRFIGFLIRLVALVAAALMLVLTVILGFVLVLIWPLLPLLAVGLVIWGVL